MTRFVHIGFNFEGEAPIKELEAVFNKAVDWLRYDDRCWILYTSTDLDVWRDRIRKVPGMGGGSSFLLTEFERGAYSGYQHDWVWEWLKKPR
jgi:hypothetical protein